MTVAQRQRPRGNVPLTPLKWTIESGSREFRLSPVTLRKVLRQGDIQPAADGTFSTANIVSTLFGDLKAERLKKERELVRRYSNENRIVEASFLDRSELLRCLSAIADAMTARIMASSLSREEKQDLLHDLSSIPLTLTEVADKQSVLRRNGRKDSGED